MESRKIEQGQGINNVQGLVDYGIKWNSPVDFMGKWWIQ